VRPSVTILSLQDFTLKAEEATRERGRRSVCSRPWGGKSPLLSPSQSAELKLVIRKSTYTIDHRGESTDTAEAGLEMMTAKNQHIGIVAMIAISLIAVPTIYAGAAAASMVTRGDAEAVFQAWDPSAH
jgi:hypothetical protein